MIADQVGNDFLRQEVEYFRISEEARDVDKQVLGEMVELDGIVPQNLEIAVHVTGLD